MSTDAGRDRPHLFMLRLWAEDAGGAATEWRGKVQSLPDGEAYHFRSWEGLIAHLQTMLQAGSASNSRSESQQHKQQKGESDVTNVHG